MTDKLEHLYLEDSLWLVTPVRFFQDRPEDPALQCSKYECKQRLENLGWTCETLSDKARAPYTPGSAKIWFVDRRGNFFVSYARCLLMAEELFNAGLGSLHHGQLGSYYDCVLEIADGRKSEVRPYQKAATYKALLAGIDVPTAEPEAVLCLADEDGALADSSSEPARPAAVADGPSPAGPAVLPPPDDNPRLRRPPATGEERAQHARQKPVRENAGSRQRHEKSRTFGDHDIRFVISSPVNQWRAFCSNPKHVEDSYICNKSMRVNQASSEEAVMRRLKAWVLAGRDVETRHEHVFLTAVPSETDAGTDAELEARLLQ